MINHINLVCTKVQINYTQEKVLRLKYSRLYPTVRDKAESISQNDMNAMALHNDTSL